MVSFGMSIEDLYGFGCGKVPYVWLLIYAGAMKKTGRAAVLLRGSLARYERQPAQEAEIRAVRGESNRAIAAGDIAGIAASLEEDFVVVIGDGTFLNREDYVAAFRHGFEQPSPLAYERTPHEVHLSTSLPIAAEHGRWVARLPEGRVLSTGTYMAMWRKAEVGWKLRSEMFVSLT